MASPDDPVPPSRQRRAVATRQDPALGMLTQDAFWDGRLSLWQPARGYRAGTDALLLAASLVSPDPYQRAVDLGCGAGVATIAAARRHQRLFVTGVEIQPAMAELARRNAWDSGVEAYVRIIEGDVLASPRPLPDGEADHVLINPPYFDPRTARPSPQAQRAASRTLDPDQGVEGWVRAARLALKPRGMLWMIWRADQMIALLTALDRQGFGAIRLLPVQSLPDQPAKLVLVQARPQSGAPLRLLPGLVLADGHGPDGTLIQSARSVALFRNGAALASCVPGWDPTA